MTITGSRVIFINHRREKKSILKVLIFYILYIILLGWREGYPLVPPDLKEELLAEAV